MQNIDLQNKLELFFVLVGDAKSQLEEKKNIENSNLTSNPNNNEMGIGDGIGYGIGDGIGGISGNTIPLASYPTQGKNKEEDHKIKFFL